ncbi:unnamed protein product, partial [Amoebophrya sp. A25]|eukprot:GSA25T00016290001.1
MVGYTRQASNTTSSSEKQKMKAEELQSFLADCRSCLAKCGCPMLAEKYTTQQKVAVSSFVGATAPQKDSCDLLVYQQEE